MSDHESAVAAWLDNPTTKAEIKVVLARLPNISYHEAAFFALAVEILASLDSYGMDCEESCECSDCLAADDEEKEDEEPWKH